MASGTPDVGSNTNYDQYSNGQQVMSGGTMDYGGAQMNMQNSALYSPSELNPSAASYVTNNSGIYGQLSNSSVNPFNTDIYSQTQANNQASLTSSLQNQYASMGLSGSSAEMGGLSNAITQSQLQAQKQQMGAQLQYSGALSGLNQQGYTDTMGIQNQYSDYQDSYNQSIANLLGVQQQSQASNNQMWGQIIAGGMQAGGNAAMMAAMSDRNLKKEIAPIKDALSKVKRLSGVEWEWKEHREQPGLGVIAQDVAEVFPRAVSPTKDGLMVQYHALVGPLVEAVKELSDKLDQANARISSLERGIA